MKHFKLFLALLPYGLIAAFLVKFGSAVWFINCIKVALVVVKVALVVVILGSAALLLSLCFVLAILALVFSGEWFVWSFKYINKYCSDSWAGNSDDGHGR